MERPRAFPRGRNVVQIVRIFGGGEELRSRAPQIETAGVRLKMTGIFLLCAAILILVIWPRFLGRLGPNVRDFFHRLTGFKHWRCVIADEIGGALAELAQNSDCKLSYRVTRVDDLFGGFFAAGDASARLKKRGGNASLWELRRLTAALKLSIEGHPHLGFASAEEKRAYKEKLPILEAALAEAENRVAARIGYHRSVNAMDLATKQLWIASLSATASFASACAAIASAYATWLHK